MVARAVQPGMDARARGGPPRLRQYGVQRAWAMQIAGLVVCSDETWCGGLCAFGGGEAGRGADFR